MEIEEITFTRGDLHGRMMKTFPWRCESLRQFYRGVLELRQVPQSVQQLIIPPVVGKLCTNWRDEDAV